MNNRYGFWAALRDEVASSRKRDIVGELLALPVLMIAILAVYVMLYATLPQ